MNGLYLIPEISINTRFHLVHKIKGQKLRRPPASFPAGGRCISSPIPMVSLPRRRHARRFAQDAQDYRKDQKSERHRYDSRIGRELLQIALQVKVPPFNVLHSPLPPSIFKQIINNLSRSTRWNLVHM